MHYSKLVLFSFGLTLSLLMAWKIFYKDQQNAWALTCEVLEDIYSMD